MRSTKAILTAISAAAIFAEPGARIASAAQEEGRTERVQLAKGATSTAIKGQVKGHQYVDYQLRAGAGQMCLDAEPLRCARNESNPLAWLDFFDADSRLVAHDAPPRAR